MTRTFWFLFVLLAIACGAPDAPGDLLEPTPPRPDDVALGGADPLGPAGGGPTAGSGAALSGSGGAIQEPTGGAASGGAATGGESSSGGSAAGGSASGGSGGSPPNPDWCKVGKLSCDGYASDDYRGRYFSDAACSDELLPVFELNGPGPFVFCFAPDAVMSTPSKVYRNANPYGGASGYIWVKWFGSTECVKTLLAEAPVVGTSKGGSGVLVAGEPEANPEDYAPRFCTEEVSP
jgi:hypothetical protein